MNPGLRKIGMHTEASPARLQTSPANVVGLRKSYEFNNAAIILKRFAKPTN